MTYSYRNGQWTPEKTATLTRMWKQGYRLEAIADECQTTPTAVRQKVERLGLPPREENIGNWKPEVTKLLQDRWAEGYSASVIADEIQRTYDLPITRNAVIGKARRLNLESRKGGRTDDPGIKNRRLNVRLRKVRSKPHGRPLVAFPVVPLPKAAPDPDPASWIKFEALAPTGCRWLHGDPLGHHGYCGLEAVPGKAWCHHHLARVYIQLDVRRPKKQWDEETKNKIRELRELIYE